MLPGLRGADPSVLHRIEAGYGLSAEPEAIHPEPFTAPSLFLFGRQDDVVGFEDGWSFRDHYPRASYVVLDAAGHNAHLERPSLTGALISDWLLRMDAP